MSTILSKVQKYMKVDEATSNRDDVTPVYLLEEVYDMAAKGDDVAGLVDFMIKRLQHRSPVVKHKTLRLIKYVSSKKAPEFKRLMGRHAAAVRELTHYRGEPDPFKGDVPNQKVRHMAKEALEALFSAAEPPSYSQSQASTTKGRIQGFGNSANVEPTTAYSSSAAYGPGTGGGSAYGGTSFGTGSQGGSSSRYVGFGNPMMESKAPPSNTVATMNATLDYAKQWAIQAGQAVGITGMKPSNSRSMLGETPYGGSSSFSGMGGGSNSYAAPSAPQQYNSQAATALPSVRSAPSAPGADESRVVESICRPGGVRPQPERADLADFVEAVSILDGNRVALLLEERMVGGPWQTSLRALCALEAVINQGASSSCGEIAVHFQNNPDAVQAAASSTQASLRIRANSVLEMLGHKGPSGPGTPARAQTDRPANTASQPELSLLDFGTDDPPAVPAGSGALSAAAVADLLGGDDMPSQAKPSAEGNSMFAGLDVDDAKPAPAAGSADATADLFGGLSLTTADQPATVSLLDGGAANAGTQGPGSTEAPAVAAKSLSSLAELLPPSNTSQSSLQGMMSQGYATPVAAAGGGTAGGSRGFLGPSMGYTNAMPNMMAMPGMYQRSMPMQQGMIQQGMMPMQQGMIQQGMMPVQQGMMPQGMMPMPQGMIPSPMQQHSMGGMQGGMHDMLHGLPVMQGPVPPGAIPVIQGAACQPMMPGYMSSKPAANGAGPIPLEAFHTATPTPTITPKQDDKFDFIGDALRKQSHSGHMNGF